MPARRRIVINQANVDKVVATKLNEDNLPICRLVSLQEAAQIDDIAFDENNDNDNCEIASMSMGHGFFATALAFGTNHIQSEGYANLIIESQWRT